MNEMKINQDANAQLMKQKYKAKEAEIDDFQPKFKELLEKKDKKALEKVSKDFESIFVSMVFKTMRSSIPESSLVESSHGRKIFEGMLDEEYAKNIAEKGGFGIADMIMRSFEPYLNEDKEKTSENSIDIKA